MADHSAQPSQGPRRITIWDWNDIERESKNTVDDFAENFDPDDNSEDDNANDDPSMLAPEPGSPFPLHRAMPANRTCPRVGAEYLDPERGRCKIIAINGQQVVAEAVHQGPAWAAHSDQQAKDEEPKGDHTEQPKNEQQRTGSRQNLHSYVSRPAKDIPPRPWIHAKHFIRKLVTMTVAPGGYGKTALEMLNAIEMALGIGLIGPPPVAGAVNVLYWNAEDSPDEVDRRIAAICQHYEIDQYDLEGRLFFGSKIIGGRFATFNQKTSGLEINHQLLEETKRFILMNNIGCAMFDPLIAFHSIPESQNGPMEELIKTHFEQMADDTNCNFELSHHTRKPSNGAHGGLTADDSRGASSVVFAARSARILNVMTSAEAEIPNIRPEDRRLYVRVTRDKANLCPPGKATWIHLISVLLPNGDDVQVVTAWDYPQPFDDVTTADMHWARETVRTGTYRADTRSKSWFGRALAERLGFDVDSKGDRKRMHAVIKTWMDNGVLATETRKDENRHDRQFIVPGLWQETPNKGASVGENN